jgi:hypothetical protein
VDVAVLGPLARRRALPERATGREESTLRVHVSHLRDVLEAGRGGAAPRVIVTVGSAYMLGDGVEVDLTRFERLASQGRELVSAHPEKALELLNEALGLWRGRPLQDLEHEEFAQEAIRRLEAAREEAILNRAEALVEPGRRLTSGTGPSPASSNSPSPGGGETGRPATPWWTPGAGRR